MELSSLYSPNCNGNGNGHHSTLNPPKPAGESASLPGENPQAPFDREASGRFAQGNRGGPGNPYNRKVAEYKRQF